MTYNEASRAYREALDNGCGSVLEPSRAASTVGRNGTWTLRNSYRFLARVTARGAVLDGRFQPVEVGW